jgi:capsular polysaccharide transport system permease protein
MSAVPPNSEATSPEIKLQRAQPLGKSHLTVVPRVIIALILREMSSTYGRKPGGYVWAVLEPLATISIMALAFGVFLHSPSLGTNFFLFYATGVLTLNFFRDISGKISLAIAYNRPLLTYPRVALLDSLIARGILSFMTQFMVSVIVLTGIYAMMDVNEHINFGPVLAGLGLGALLGAGMGTLNAFVMIRFPVWTNLWAIVSRPLAFVSGLFYIYEDLPPIAQSVLWFNPLIHVTGLVRQGVYATYHPGYISVPYVLAFGIVPLVFGLLLIRRFGRSLLTE